MRHTRAQETLGSRTKQKSNTVSPQPPLLYRHPLQPREQDPSKGPHSPKAEKLFPRCPANGAACFVAAAAVAVVVVVVYLFV